MSPHQREASQNPSKNQIKITTHIRPIRDRGDRFPSFIDAFCAVRDCFRLGFERFFDRFCFLQHLLALFLSHLFFSFLSLLIELDSRNSNSTLLGERDFKTRNITQSFHTKRGRRRRRHTDLKRKEERTRLLKSCVGVGVVLRSRKRCTK